MAETPTILDQYGNPIGQEISNQILDKDGQPLISENGEQLGNSEKESEENNEENCVPSKTAEKVSKVEKASTAATVDNEEVMSWLAEAGIENVDAETFQLFQNVLSEKHGERQKNPEAWAETVKLLKELPQILKTFNEQIVELAKDEGFKDIENKKKTITKALCRSVLNGHMEASDILAAVKNVAVIKDKTAQGIQAATTGVCFYDFANRQILISEGFLKDRTPDKELNIDHLINHEISHAVVEYAVKTPQDNAELMSYVRNGAEIQSEKLGKVFEIIKKAKETKDFQPQHVRNVLANLENVPTEYVKLDDQEKQRYGSQEVYQRVREKVAAEEIITDYTAVFLESDGSKQDYFIKCLNLCSVDGLKNYLSDDNQPVTPSQWLKDLNSKVENGETPSEIAQNNPKLKEMLDTYGFFFELASSSKENFKGKLAELMPEEVEEEKEDWLTGSNLTLDNPSGFKNNNQKNDSILNELKGFFVAFANEAGKSLGAGN